LSLFGLPVLEIPDSTLLLTFTAIGFGLISNLITRRFVDLDAERRVKAEINEYTKAVKAATKAGNKHEQEKLKKKEASINQMRLKMSSARSKVALYTIVPFFVIYYLVLSFVGPTAAISPFPIPYLAQAEAPGGGFAVSQFGWYLISSFAFSGLMTKLLKTQT